MAQRNVQVGKIAGNRGRINITTGNIVENIQHIYERSLTAAEGKAKARSLEYKLLASGVSSLLKRMRTAAEEPTLRSPYKGLLYYELADSGGFFGREKDIQNLLSVIDQGSFTILYSESGAGKTSLLQAGIVPRLIAGGDLPIYLRSHDKNPSLAIKKMFTPDLSQVPNLKKAPLMDVLQRVGEIIGPQTTLYFLLDQFEEFFTKTSDLDQKVFVEELADCLDNSNLKVHWLISMRKEYFGHLGIFSARIRNPYENYFYLNKLARNQAHEVITKSAKKYRLSFEKGLTNRILDDLGKDSIDPPQLQLVCKALYEETLDQQKPLTIELYEREGSASGILSDHVKRVLSRDIPPARRAIARQLLESLVTSVPQRAIRSHQELTEQLASRKISAEDLNTVLSQLINSHLVRAEETEEGLRYELVHDYLLEEIRLDPQTKQRKLAEELLKQGTENWTRHGMLLGRDAIEIIDQERRRLKPNRDEVQLLILSAIEQKLNPTAWKPFLDKEARLKIIEENTAKLNDKDKRVQQRANALLWFFATDQPRSMRGKYLLKEIPRRGVVNVLPQVTKYSFLTVATLSVLFVLTIASSVGAGGWRPVSTLRSDCLSDKKPGLLEVSVDRNRDSNFAVYDQTNNALCESIDAGSSWSNMALPSTKNVVDVDAGNHKIFVVYKDEIYYKEFGEEPWTALVPPEPVQGDFAGLAVNPEKPEEILLASSGNELLVLRNIEKNLTASRLDTAQVSQAAQPTEQTIGISTDGHKIVLATTDKIWFSDYPEITWQKVDKTKTPQDVHSIVIYEEHFYGVTDDARITTGEFDRAIMLGPQAKGESPLPRWTDPDDAVQSFTVTDSVTLVGNSSGLKCYPAWSWLRPEWWRLLFFRNKPCQ